MNEIKITGDNPDENKRATADTAGAESEKAVTALGKFKDVETLVKAYTDLEAEFTRRSQRLKELECGNKAEKPDGAQPSQSEIISSALADEKVRDAVIGEYLKSVSANKGVPLLSGGGGVSGPKALHQSVKEAGRLAQEFLNK